MPTTILLALILLAAGPVHADTVYSYVGGFFVAVTGEYTTTDRITGSFTMADGFTPAGFGCLDPCSETWRIGVVGWNFTDGHQTFTQANSTDHAEIRWFQGGSRPYWFINFSNALGYLVTLNAGDWGDNGASASGSGANSYICCSTMGTWTVETVFVPERAILPRLPRLLKFGLGLGLEARVTNMLQHATAWSSMQVLRALRIPVEREGLRLALRRVRVEVAEACSGLQTLLLMLGAAALLAAVLPQKNAILVTLLFLGAIVLALEANALRVAGIAIGLDQMGAMSRAGKDWIQMGTTGIALAQLVGLGRLAAR